MITLPSGRKIGEGGPCFIIAEVGSNWRNLDDCLESIRQAKLAGADAVKFQAFNWTALYGVPPTPSDDTGLPLTWLPAMKAEADRAGIEFMCSAFSPDLIRAVDPFVNIHKVASAECTHKRMLEELAKIGKPVILSTGAHGGADIKAALSVLGYTPSVLLYCVAAYPAREVDLAHIPFMQEAFNVPVGYSDHTTDVLIIPRQAVIQGAVALEKHVTFIDADTPDSPHSLSGPEFKRMARSIRACDSRVLGVSPHEKPMILRHNRRLIATKDIKSGEIFRACPEPGIQNFGIYRSLKDETHAYHPFMIDQVDGRIAKRAVKAGDGIGPGDIDL